MMGRTTIIAHLVRDGQSAWLTARWNANNLFVNPSTIKYHEIDQKRNRKSSLRLRKVQIYK